MTPDFDHGPDRRTGPHDDRLASEDLGIENDVSMLRYLHGKALRHGMDCSTFS
jgi:hypothetical protein